MSLNRKTHSNRVCWYSMQTDIRTSPDCALFLRRNGGKREKKWQRKSIPLHRSLNSTGYFFQMNFLTELFKGNTTILFMHHWTQDQGCTREYSREFVQPCAGLFELRAPFSFRQKNDTKIIQFGNVFRVIETKTIHF